MIIKNLIIGMDKFGNKLQCGDICNFDIKLHRPHSVEAIETMKGMIVYDEDTFSFAFETLDNFAPLLLMNCVEERSIEKLFEANLINFNNIPNGVEWNEIYNNNVKIF